MSHDSSAFHRHLLAVPRFRLNTYGRRAFSVAGPTVWNSLPDFIRDPTSSTDCLGVYLKRTCSRVTSASSALVAGQLSDMMGTDLTKVKNFVRQFCRPYLLIFC